jgi:hypothetical protein
LPVDGRAIEFCLHGFEKLRINDRLMFAGVRLAAIGLRLWNDAVERNVSNRTKVTLTVNWVQAAVSGIERSGNPSLAARSPKPMLRRHRTHRH